MNTENTGPVGSDSSAGLCRDALALYLPPFRFDHGYIFDSNHRMVADNEGQDVALRVRGWGRISHMPTPESLQDKVGELIAEALTEYWTRHNARLSGPQRPAQEVDYGTK